MGLCTKCAKVKLSCCIERDIFITENDIERINQTVEDKDYYEYRKPLNPEYLVQDDDPNWNEYTVQKDGTRRVLKHKPGMVCIFLSSNGCELSYDTRPLICRIYPYYYNEEKLLELECDCPVELLEPGENILSSLGMDTHIAEQWRKQLYNELVSEKIRKQYLQGTLSINR